jgi:catechol 2,3-dioxygenase-like lactoylglutathione lyase family enzyme
MGVRSLDHVGVVVDDLEAAVAFFVDLGLERGGAGTPARPTTRPVRRSTTQTDVLALPRSSYS